MQSIHKGSLAIQQVHGKLLLSNAWFNHSISQGLINFNNSIHPTEVNNDLSIRDGTGVSISPILSPTDGIKRNTKSTRNFYDLHNIFRRARA